MDGIRYAGARSSVDRQKRYETKVRMVWGSFLIAAAALKTPTRNGYNAQGANLTFRVDIQVCVTNADCGEERNY